MSSNLLTQQRKYRNGVKLRGLGCGVDATLAEAGRELGGRRRTLNKDERKETFCVKARRNAPVRRRLRDCGGPKQPERRYRPQPLAARAAEFGFPRPAI